MPRPTHPTPNTLVRIRGQRWRVLRSTPYPASATLDVIGAGAENRGQSAAFVLPFEPCEPILSNPAPRRLPRRTWRRVVRRTLADAVPTPEALRTATSARFSLLPYQLEPVQAYLRGDSVRLLIADGVGMGKTIQAGLIVSETIARQADARVLVVVPAALRTQWHDELHERFALDTVVIDAAGLWQLSCCLPADINPWTARSVVITSIDFVKRAEVLRSLDGLVWDLMVFDEAHALAGRSDRYAAASGLAGRATTVVLLTATPHSGDQEAYLRLCRLGNLENRFPLDVFRRERADVATIPSRRVRWLDVRPAPADTALHVQLFEYARRVWHEAATPGAHLAMLVLLKRGASSTTALTRSLARRRALLEATQASPDDQPLLPFDPEGDSEPGNELGSPGFASGLDECEALDALIRGASAAMALTRKVSLLQRLIRRTREPVLVFTQYRDTLDELQHVLAAFEPICLHGGLTERERHAAVRGFTNGNARVLLATDAASEGLNLHARCRLVVSVDLPWTPLRMEQRVGRVDRIGQTRTVHAWLLVAGGTYETAIAERVRARAETARTALHVDTADESTTAAEILTGHMVPSTASPLPAWPPGYASTRRALAVTEACRVQVARALGERAASVVEGRPCITAFRGCPKRTVGAYRATCVDPSGTCVFDTLIGVALRPNNPTDDAGIGLAQMMSTARAACAARGVLRSLRRMTALSLWRHRAIERSLRQARARLSGTLLQRRLFTNRKTHGSTAQAHLLGESLIRTRERATRLRAAGRMSLESVSLACAAIWR